jgi:RimJ/RimL family protein N-acetyltransferase
MGLWISEEHQLGGLGTEAASAGIRWVDAVHKPAAIDAMVSPENSRSVSLVRRLGMSTVARERAFITVGGTSKLHLRWKIQLGRVREGMGAS